MKKFLSLVLALALTMSLVVIPANADTVDVTGVTLNKTSVTLYAGDTQTLTATVKPSDATNKTVTWKSDKESVARVDNDGEVTAVAKGTAKITVTTEDGNKTATCQVTVKDKYELTVKETNPQLYFNGDTTSVTLHYTLKEKGVTVPSSDYTVELSESSSKIDTKEGKTITLEDGVNAEAKNISVTATAKVGGVEVATATIKVDIVDRYEARLANNADEVTVTIGNTKKLTAPTLYDKDKQETVSSTKYTVEYDIGKADPSGCIKLKSEKTVSGEKAGKATVTATIELTETKDEYTVEYTITVEKAKLAVKLDEVVNGGKDHWDDDDLEDAVIDALEDAISSYDDDEDVEILKIKKNSVAGGKLYDEDDKALSSSEDLMDGDTDLYFEATEGYIGDATFDITTKIDGETYEGTLTIPVVAEDDDIDITVSAEEGSKKATFVLPDDYDYWYICEGSSKSGMFDGLWGNSSAPNSVVSWSKRYAKGAEYELALSKFDDGAVTLYVVGVEDDIASTGELEVTLDAYDIEYSGAAGEKIVFDQDDFDDFLEDAAEDSGLIGKKSSTAYVEFKNVVFTVPTEKTQGVLYNNGTKITKSATKCTDLNKVSFTIADKADEQVYLKFTLTYDYYKDDRSSTKADEKTMSGRVLVNVIREDIKYVVPVNSSVTFNTADFQKFFASEYKNGTLNYVQFTDLPKVTDGALYATYNTLYAGTLAKTNDKFYYDSKKATDYDLDDVTFKSSIWSKAGDKVYIPFTAYGTKSSQSVKGCIAITIAAAKTMNFTDVSTADWFYKNVKNAYEMGLIEGKTVTTFNPNDNMTYAEAVTLAARMNELYYTGKVTLENSKTGNWYSSYETYAINKGIISSALGTKANMKITRKDYVEIFYNALPASAYTARNSISKIPDLANDSTNAKIYTFYKAGILTGYANTPGKTNYAFGPNDNIKRSEVATILIRMMDASTRVTFSL